MLVSVCFEPIASVWKKGLGSVNSVNDLVPIELENGSDPIINGVDAAVLELNLDPTFRVVEVTKRLLCSPELSIAPEGTVVLFHSKLLLGRTRMSVGLKPYMSAEVSATAQYSVMVRFEEGFGGNASTVSDTLP